ncbi:flippase-like domain-containing protein [Lujinxingia vulgaris]|uniref:Flippase-like domain-containing protein n=1 Tax=Lujinxingia vulgaris TaxID=2600176 RepID=A0A5C6XJT4_9DELT|nr:lysylphosphatidylglycerol synthase transmembrane domain-containing protein [Lujinxingia vulgaris]TXD39200.1 flippase-like domain-containing protein [Lujinxingia vulgaris]
MSSSSPTPDPGPAPLRLARLMWAVVLAVLLYGGFALWADLDQLIPALQQVPIKVVILACALSAVNYGFRFLRWQLYLQRLSIDVPWRPSLQIFLAGLVMSISPGKVGEVLKSALLRRSFGVPVARSAPVVFAERLTDLLGLFAIGALGVLTFEFGAGVFVGALAAVLALIGALQSQTLINALLTGVGRIPRLARLQAPLRQAYSSTRTLLSPTLLGATTLLSALSWSLEGLAFWCILDALGASELTLYKALFVYAISTLLGALSFLPGGLGLTEGSMVGALMLLGLFTANAPALAATYLIRLATLWFGVGVGALSLLSYERRPPTGHSDSL